MRTLIFGAGPLGSLYAHLLHQSGADVTVLARGARPDWIAENGLVLVNEMTGAKEASRVGVVDALRSGDAYDLVIVLVRKNKLPPVFEALADHAGVQNVLFMGNNALGFDDYLRHLPAERLLFGFPGAGGGFRDQVVYYADRESPKGKRRPVTLGAIDGRDGERIAAVRSLFVSTGVPVDETADIDGWLKYHVALVSPLVGALYKHDCDCRRAAEDRGSLRTLVRAAKEGRLVLRARGFTEWQPVQFTLFRWLPEFLSVIGVKKLFSSRFAEIAFAMHARSARDEMKALVGEFQELKAKTSVATPNIDALASYV